TRASAPRCAGWRASPARGCSRCCAWPMRQRCANGWRRGRTRRKWSRTRGSRRGRCCARASAHRTSGPKCTRSTPARLREPPRPVSPSTHLVGTLGTGARGAATYVLVVLVLFALYAGALTLVLTRRVWPAPAAVLGGAAIFSLLLWLTHPLTSTDIFNYIASAR